jgi:glycosyltransferase involved in cell wall biosynthesis
VKILFFINGLAAGGKERRLVELMKGLKKDSSIEFELAVMDQDIHYKEVFDLGIKIHFLIRKAKKDLSVFFKLYSISKKIRPDILHCWDSMTAMYSAPVCRLLNIKLANGLVVGAPEKSTLFDTTYRRGKLTFPFSDYIIGNSEAGLTAYRAPRKKSVCIHNGFNFERLNTLIAAPEQRGQLEIKTDYVIGMVASFSAFKDYKTFFQAAQMLLEERNDITFLAIGSDTDSEDARKIIQDKFIGHFKLLGKRSDVETLINLMDIAVLSTFTEGISNSILEYMALGKPVIATEGGGTNEIVVDGITGFLVKRSFARELSDKMNILLNDTSLRLMMGSAGKERIHNHFSIERMVNKYVSVYNRLYNN